MHRVGTKRTAQALSARVEGLAAQRQWFKGRSPRVGIYKMCQEARQLRGKNILITGGAGFIGSTLTSHLADTNRIILFDNLHRDTLRYTSLAEHPHVTFIQGDVLDYHAVEDALAGVDIVVHAAAIAGIDTVIRDPVLTMEVNMLGTANVLRASQRRRVSGRVLEFSTSEVFGSMAFRSSETDQTVAGSAGEARWTYAVSKLAGEHLAKAYHTRYGLPIVTIRPFNVYGPGQTGEGALQVFIRKALKGEAIRMNGDGSQIRAWCYVDDMIEALISALVRPEAIGESFNIGNARAVMTIYSLATTIIRLLNSQSEIIFDPPLSADIALRIPETGKATKLLGFKARVELEEGILKTAEWYIRNQLPAAEHAT